MLIINTNHIQKFVKRVWHVKKPDFRYTFALEKLTKNELPFGQYEKTLFAPPRSGAAALRLQHKKQVR